MQREVLLRWRRRVSFKSEIECAHALSLLLTFPDIPAPGLHVIAVPLEQIQEVEAQLGEERVAPVVFEEVVARLFFKPAKIITVDQR